MTERSFWGWGEADRFPEREERRTLADRLEAELGFPELTLRDPPTIEDCQLPESRVSLPSALADVATTDRSDRIRHTYGKSYPDLVRGFNGEFGRAPDVVARPEDEADIAAILEWAGEHDIAVVPFGGGTSVVGGIEPDLGGRGAIDSGATERQIGDFEGVVSLSLREFDAIEAVDTHSRRARLQAGLLGPEINEGLAEYDLQLRHYPQSYEFSTLGGWIATRAGGHFATVYTHIDDFVESLRAVTPTGSLETRDVPASGAGPDPNRLFLGSEGALGVITSAWVTVQPRPEYRARATVRFDDFWDGVAASRDIVQARLYPANCRLLDPTEAMINEVAVDGSSILVLGFESVDHPVDGELGRALELCRDHGGRCPDGPTIVGPDDGAASDGKPTEETDRDNTEGDWRQSFFEGPYLFNQLVSMGVLVDTFETAVTWDRFPDLHAAIQREVTKAMTDVCGMGVLSCRFTHVYPDGPAPYYTLLAPATQGEELAQWRAIKSAASDVLLDHGATITHHHAVGRVHRQWYAEETPEEYRSALQSMKRTLDPAGIMNPGALLE